MKTCRECRKEKPVDDYMVQHKSSDGRAHICTACRLKRRNKKRADVASSAAEDSAIETGDDAGPMIKRGPALGFTAQLQDGDVVLEQETAGGKVSIWLSRHEATEFSAWVIAGCASRESAA